VQQCRELDDKIAHYNRMAIHITDQLTLDVIAGLIKKMTAERAAIRCETEKR
jgi:hypothetical protein